MEQHLVLGGDPRKLGHPLLGEGANRGGQHPKIWGGWRRGTPQNLGAHLDLGEGLGAGDLEGEEGLATDEELHGGGCWGGFGESQGGPHSPEMGGRPLEGRGGSKERGGGEGGEVWGYFWGVTGDVIGGLGLVLDRIMAVLGGIVAVLGWTVAVLGGFRAL